MWKYLHQAKLAQKQLFAQLKSTNQTNQSEENQFLSHNFSDNFSFSYISNPYHTESEQSHQAFEHDNSLFPQTNDRNTQCTVYVEIHCHGQTLMIEQPQAESNAQSLIQIQNAIENQINKKVSANGLAKIAEILRIPYDAQSNNIEEDSLSLSFCNGNQSKQSVAKENIIKIAKNTAKHKIPKIANKENIEKKKSYFQQYKSKRN